MKGHANINFTIEDSAAEYIRMIHISRYKTVISSQCFLKKMEAALSLVGGVWKVYQTWKALEEQPIMYPTKRLHELNNDLIFQVMNRVTTS